MPTPILDGTVTPNQEALDLLSGFALGSVKMDGDIVQHLPVVQGNQSTGESLSELPWYLPESVKKTDGSAIRSRKAILAVKAPRSHSVTNTQEGLLAAQHPHH